MSATLDLRPGPLSRLPGATGVSWGMTHGLGRALMGRAARRGEPLARIMMDRDLRADPYEVCAEVRSRGPLVRGRLMWLTADHAVCNQVLRSDAFGVDRPEMPPPLRQIHHAFLDRTVFSPVDPPSLLAIDPPEHTRLRRLVSRVFTPRAVAAVEPAMHEVATRLLDRIDRSGYERFDLVDAYAAQLPVAIIAEVLGVPDEMHADLLEWGNGAALTLDPALTLRQYAHSRRCLERLHTWFQAHVAELRRHPREDLLSRLATLDGEERLTDAELAATGLLVLGAGFETTVNLIGNAVAQLSDHPAQREMLREEPALWGNAVEEVLRYDSPVQLTGRMVRTETEVAGRTLKPGHGVMAILAGANRDPAVFEEPDAFDVRRGNAADHVAFSAGVHYCLGANLARLETRVALQALYARYDRLVADGPRRRRETKVLRGYERLVVSRGGHSGRSGHSGHSGHRGS